MTVDVVAKKDLADGIRSKLLLALIALFVLFMGGLAYLTTQGTFESSDAILQTAIAAAIAPVIFLVPITGLVVSIKSIVRERELGSLNLLLSLPHTRAEVFFGKFVGRSGLLTLAIVAGFVPAGILFTARTDGFPILGYLGLMIMSILFGIAFVAIGVSFSAFVSTETRATVGGIGVFVLLYFWNLLFVLANARLDLLDTESDLFLFIQRFHLQTVFADGFSAIITFWFDEVPPASAVVSQTNLGGGGSIPPQPFYLQDWFAFVILALYVAVPLAIGYLRFNSVDL